MLTRREFVQVAVATAVLSAGAGGRKVKAQGALRQEDLLRFEPRGQVTLLHVADLHAQLRPIYVREPSVNIGAGELDGRPPHLTGKELLEAYNLQPRSLEAYMLTPLDYAALAESYGRVGGVDRLATLIGAIRAERGAERVLLLDSGDALQGSYSALHTRGADMADILAALRVEATTGHWEFTLGAARVTELYGTRHTKGRADVAFLAANVFEADFGEPVFHARRMFEKGGVRIAVIGQAFPYSPIANPAWLMPDWSFGIREGRIRRQVAAARADGAELVVLLSHNGFDVDRKLAGRVDGIDIILTGHTHDALPEPVRVGSTLLIASGSHGKFLSRLDVEVESGRMKDYRYRLIPVLASAITPDPGMSALVAAIRAPHEAMLAAELARTDTLLYRRGNFNGTLDDLICDAMLSVRDAEICLSPGFRWGATLIPGQSITWEDVYNATAITYPACYRTSIRGDALKTILEDVADNLFNPDPYYQQGGDMVRVGGLQFTIDPKAPMGRRISDIYLVRNGEPLEAGRDYVMAGWASVNQNTSGPPIWDVVATHLSQHRVVDIAPRSNVRLKA